MQTVSLTTAYEPLEGFHCWLRTGEETGVEAVVLRAASQGFAVYGLRVARAQQVANIFPWAGLDRDLTDVRIRGTISSRVTFHVGAGATNDE
jgi:hypothetical protein